ncbi:MAG: type II/IV secretion system protein [Candidatus Omnitrophica bacterium]|nr:type II/IV secretion system protein [Candidatus Omnitrophota bacterium]
MKQEQAKRLEEELVEEGLLTVEQIAQAQQEAARSGETLRQALSRLKLIEPGALADWLSRRLGIPRVELKSYLIDPKVLETVPEALSRKHRMIPLFKVGRTLTVATSDPLNLPGLDELRLRTGMAVEPVVATEGEILQALEECYGAKGRVEELVGDLTEEKLGLKQGEAPEAKRLEGIVSDPPLVRLVNLFLSDAIRNRASDVHLDPSQEQLKVRFRIDGILHESTALPKHLEPAVVSRIKILASLDIAERRKPQDGRFRIMMDGHEVDVRVSVMPAIDGEAVVLRLLDTTGIRIGLHELGMATEFLPKYQALLKRPWGILLVTGPTGSGKTTTLYASLASLNAAERNIITIEDPVEYRLAGIRQIPVNPTVGLTFATGLRSILRQDPDVIMVGEIRDRETAEIAIQAALTGHLVFSTLHTNDAPTAITRLLDMGIEPFLVASSLIGVAAQRLVRTICPDCKAPAPNPAPLPLPSKTLFHGKGCRKCGNSGYRGRLGIFELMAMDEEMGRLTIAKASTAGLREHAVQKGMRTLRDDGISKAADGVTTLDEVLRVTQEQ